MILPEETKKAILIRKIIYLFQGLVLLQIAYNHKCIRGILFGQAFEESQANLVEQNNLNNNHQKLTNLNNFNPLKSQPTASESPGGAFSTYTKYCPQLTASPVSLLILLFSGVIFDILLVTIRGNPGYVNHERPCAQGLETEGDFSPGLEADQNQSKEGLKYDNYQNYNSGENCRDFHEEELEVNSRGSKFELELHPYLKMQEIKENLLEPVINLRTKSGYLGMRAKESKDSKEIEMMVFEDHQRQDHFSEHSEGSQAWRRDSVETCREL